MKLKDTIANLARLKKELPAKCEVLAGAGQCPETSIVQVDPGDMLDEATGNFAVLAAARRAGLTYSGHHLYGTRWTFFDADFAPPAPAPAEDEPKKKK